MKEMRPHSVLMFAVAAVAVALAGCKEPGSRGGVLLNKPEPLLEGTWEGSVSIADQPYSLRVTVEQTNIKIKGTFTAPAPCPGAGCTAAAGDAVFGATGEIAGVTSGFGVTLTLTPGATEIGCDAEQTLSGFNDGTVYAFNASGTDCAGNAVSGQGTLQRL